MLRAVEPHIARFGLAVALIAPGGLVLGLALASGGFFPDSVSVAVIIVIVIFSVRAVFSSTPFGGLSVGFSIVAVAMIGFTTLTLVSGSWSGSSARSTFAYNLALLYTAVLVLTGVLGRSAARARVMLYGLSAASVAISIASAATWLLPHLLPTASDVGRYRLSWPTSYWNATGLIAAFALIWTSALTCSSTQPARIRVLAAMSAPIPAATLIFTASRGAVAVAVLGVVLSAVIIRSWATPGGLVALAPAVTASVLIGLDVNGLNVNNPAAHAIHIGQHTAVLLVALSLATAILRAALVRLDDRLARARVPWTRVQLRASLCIVFVGIVVTFLTLGGVSAVRADVHRFAAAPPDSASTSLSVQQRLTWLSNNGRIDEWRVAIDDGFLRHPVIGNGAGTYATLWTRYAPTFRRVLNAHSLYLEELAELGLVGAVPLIVIIVSILVALGRRARGPEREVWAALFAAGLMWALHAGVDWDWQMPAVTAWFFGAGALALAAPTDRPQRQTHSRVRFAVALGCLFLTVTPAAIWRSQTQLNKAVQALERGDCVTAQQAALASNAALSSRWDPFEVISYCEAGAQQYTLAISAIDAAELRDPQNWELRYSDALISAAAGLDPRPAARAALTMYPTSPLTRAAVRAFSSGSPAAWRRFAISAPLPLPWVEPLVSVPVTPDVGAPTSSATGRTAAILDHETTTN